MLKDNKMCVLSYDLSDSDKSMELFLEQRKRKSELYVAIGNYIKVLEQNIEHQEYNYLIKKQIKKLKKEQRRYYVEPLLSVCLSEEKNSNIERKNQSENNLLKLIKRKK